MVLTKDDNSDISESSLKNDNITSVESYKADMGKLGDGFLATAWVSSEFFKQVGDLEKTGAAALPKSRLAMGLKDDRSEERRVGKECRSRWSPYH